ncbi:MAG: RHS repeat-associated core domain-containing protein, partial [Ktedonobacteraceae bacterium]
LIKVTPPNTNGSTLKPYTLTVDANTSRVTAVTDGNGNQTSYSYNEFDQVNNISYAGGQTITYTYGARGSLLSVVDNTGTTSFTYDALNRLRTKTLPGGTIINTDYDKTGNLTSFNDGGGAVTYGYDAANRMTTLTEPDGAKSTYTYDPADRKTMIQYPNLTGMKMTYDAAGHELTNIGATMDIHGNILTTYASFKYNYLSGSTPRALLQSTDVLVDPYNQSTNTAWAYSYNSQNQLANANKTDAGNPLRNYTYTYDAAGNRTKDLLQRPGQSDVTNTYSYAGGNELLSKQLVGGATTTYSYDGNGNLTGYTGGPSFTYNTKNQTTKIGSDAYTYSGADQTDRVKVNTDTFVYTGLGLSAQTTASGTTHFVRCSCGLLNDERTPDGKKYYYLFDGLGSIVGMTDSTGSDVNRYVYDPYGTIISQQEQSGLNNPWKFAAGYLDSSTSLYKFGTRYYDPTLGRWTQQDPVGGSLGDLNSANRYTYAGDDPVNAVDPSGKAVNGGCIIAVLGSLASTVITGISAWTGFSAIVGWEVAGLITLGVADFLAIGWGLTLVLALVWLYDQAYVTCGGTFID